MGGRFKLWGGFVNEFIEEPYQATESILFLCKSLILGLRTTE